MTDPLHGAADAATPTGLPHRQVLRIVLGMQVAVFLAAMDQTIVAVALLTIGQDLNGFSLAPWVMAGYLVASTVSTPVYGSLSDALGRRKLMLFAVVLYVSASVLCAMAQTMPQLIGLRIIQGMGAGGLLTLSQAVVADIAPGPIRGRYQGYLAGTFATAAVFGPILGGYLTHYLSWRAIFWLNLPMGVLAFFVARWAMRDLHFTPKPHRMDHAGILLLTAMVSCAMVALTLIGKGVSPLSLAPLALVAGAFALFRLLAWQQKRASNPLFPAELFANRLSLICCIIPALGFFVMIGSTVILPMAFQSLSQVGANEVALRMLPLTFSIPTGAFIGGRLLYLTGRYRESVLVGTSIVMLTCLALALLGTEAPWRTAILMIAMGLGIGTAMPPVLVAAQMTVPHRLVGVMTATFAVFRTLGGAVGVAVLTAI
ncbi:MAG: MDR family MFS transporter, partial [Quisquiliibacterium sp.]